MFWNKKKPAAEATPMPVMPKPRQANRYLIGKHFFAEWAERREREECGEGWEIYHAHPISPKYSTDGVAKLRTANFLTDTAESAQRLLDMLDATVEPISSKG